MLTRPLAETALGFVGLAPAASEASSSQSAGFYPGASPGTNSNRASRQAELQPQRRSVRPDRRGGAGRRSHLHAKRQRLRTAALVVRTVKVWSKEVKERLQDCFESVDWTIFSDSSSDLNEYTTAFTDFIKTCVDECLPSRTFKVFPSLKPWMNQEIHSLLRARSVAFKTGDPEPYKKSRYNLRKAIMRVKRQICVKLETQLDTR
ncbi:uncharacterized protein LOC127576148 [Pristis pectinata]|uniref:uncharacterized protein LOC127576148 n=1 Tax=Pristis pectinata TaxID=685728 RepID=UPI00223CB068|nr:uncharacterized protein LOC127576148 [Pristis pectinata]